MTSPLHRDLDYILHHTKKLWEEVRGKRIFITGGTGFFGCWLLESFLWANEKFELNASATVLTRNFEAFREKAPHLASHPAIDFHIGDVQSFDFPEGIFSYIIHAARWQGAYPNGENPLLMYETIVQGTRQTLEFARICGAKKLLFTSSGAVYGKQPSDMTHIPEEYHGAPDPTDPASAYGIGKLTAEHLCVLYSNRYGLESKIARCFAFVGPYLPLDIHYAIGNFIRDGLNGGPIEVKGDGTPYRSYLYAADLAIWLWTILLKGESCRPYNVGSEEGCTIAELAVKISGTFEYHPAVKILTPAAKDNYSKRYVPSVQRAFSELGLHQQIGLEEAIKRTIAFLNYING